MSGNFSLRVSNLGARLRKIWYFDEFNLILSQNCHKIVTKKSPVVINNSQYFNYFRVIKELRGDFCGDFFNKILMENGYG